MWALFSCVGWSVVLALDEVDYLGNQSLPKSSTGGYWLETETDVRVNLARLEYTLEIMADIIAMARPL